MQTFSFRRKLVFPSVPWYPSPVEMLPIVILNSFIRPFTPDEVKDLKGVPHENARYLRIA